MTLSCSCIGLRNSDVLLHSKVTMGHNNERRQTSKRKSFEWFALRNDQC